MKNKVNVILIKFCCLSLCVFIMGLTGCSKKRSSIKVDIGYQSVTAQTWGALIIKNQHYLEDKLKEKYPDYDIMVTWHDDISGAIINNNMIAGKYQIGYMGDMPSLINGYKSKNIDNYNSRIVAIDGRGIGGKNQDILVPANSSTKSIEDLVGKTISTPIGSSAHRMLLDILNKHDIVDQVNIVHQDINVAYSLLETEKIDAFSVWAPYGKYLEKEGIAKILVDGSESGVDYLTGIIMNKDWMEENKEIADVFLQCIEESHDFINNNPDDAAKIFHEESGIPEEVCKDMVTGIVWESELTDEDIKTYEKDMDFLDELEIIERYDLHDFFGK